MVVSKAGPGNDASIFPTRQSSQTDAHAHRAYSMGCAKRPQAHPALAGRPSADACQCPDQTSRRAHTPAGLAGTSKEAQDFAISHGKHWGMV
jgi:hypothetical protein